MKSGLRILRLRGAIERTLSRCAASELLAQCVEGGILVSPPLGREEASGRRVAGEPMNGAVRAEAFEEIANRGNVVIAPGQLDFSLAPLAGDGSILNYI